MSPARNLLLRRCGDTYGAGTFFDRAQLLPHAGTILMAEKATPSGAAAQDELLQQEEEKEEEEAAEGVSGGHRRGWLQLGAPPPRDPAATGTSRKRPADQVTELELFPSRPPPLRPAAAVGAHGRPLWDPSPSSGSSAVQFMHPLGSSGPAQAAGGSQIQAVIPPPPPPLRGRSWTPSPSSSSSGMQFMQPSGSSGAAQAAGGSQIIQVVSPPPRPDTGLWLVLKAAENQIKQPFLPQISRSFLRIKDGRMTARLLMKYLANKLGLEDESEVQISCRGQQIPPLMTLQQIRDQIWCPRDANFLALPPELSSSSSTSSSSTDHLMTLHYSRIS